MRGWSRRGLWTAAAMALLSAGGAAQSMRTEDLAAGRFLVASRDLQDPNFAQTVVLLVHYGEDGVVGLIINRRTKIPLARLFEELKLARNREDTLYRGGPVEKTAALALLHSREKPEEGGRVLPDVALISSKALLEKTIAAGTESGSLRVYLGYSGWTMRQLQMEVELGSWHIFAGDAGMVFDPVPESIWPRLMRKTEERIASGGRVDKGVRYTNANHRTVVHSPLAVCPGA